MKARGEQLKLHTENSQLVLPLLVNFSAFLKVNNKPTFSRWVLLNDCVREEHPANVSLLSLSSDDVVYQGLKKYYNKQFLRITENDRKSLSSQFNNYRNIMKTCTMSTFVLLNLTIEDWSKSLEVYLYFKAGKFSDA